MTSDDKFQNPQAIWKNLSGEGQCTVSSKHKNQVTICKAVTHSAPFSSNSNGFKDKRVDNNKLDERASGKKSDIEKIQDAVSSMGDYVCATERCLNLETKPVIEIMSVRLLCNNNNNTSIRNQEPRKIFGVIFVFDVCGNTCFIYERDLDDVYDSDELDVIPVDGNGATLSLSFLGPDDLMSMHSPDICVNIQDFDTGEIIVKECAQFPLSVDTTEEQNPPFEQFRTLTIPGIANGCSAVIDYIALTYGVFAHIEVKLCASGSEEKEQGEYFLVYGKISVEYNLHHPEKRKNSITLFEIEKDSCEFQRTKLNCPITLSRSVVAVPAYSSLTVHVDLWSESKNIVQGSFACDTDNHALDGFIPGLNRTDAKLTVDWKQPLMNNAPTLCRWPRNLILPNSSNYFGLHLIEVFSLFIGHQNDKGLSIYGAINFWGGTILNIFERDKNDPYFLPPGCNMLPIQIFNKSLLPGDFSHVSVDLEDVEGLLSIKGLIVINIMALRWEEWYNRLLCSVVKGVDDRSFAALHYTIFSNALKAKLKVQFYSESEHFTNTCIRIYGSLVLRYGEYGIRTQYEKNHHQCLLFKRYKENPLEKFGNDFDLELSRSVVAVPCNSSVIIVADLSCCLSTGCTLHLRKTERFQIGTENVTIDGDQFSLRVAVSWS